MSKKKKKKPELLNINTMPAVDMDDAGMVTAAEKLYKRIMCRTRTSGFGFQREGVTRWTWKTGYYAHVLEYVAAPQHFLYTLIYIDAPAPIISSWRRFSVRGHVIDDDGTVHLLPDF